MATSRALPQHIRDAGRGQTRSTRQTDKRPPPHYLIWMSCPPTQGHAGEWCRTVCALSLDSHTSPTAPPVVPTSRATARVRRSRARALVGSQKPRDEHWTMRSRWRSRNRLRHQNLKMATVVPGVSGRSTRSLGNANEHENRSGTHSVSPFWSPPGDNRGRCKSSR